jgi:hypothetical protein
MGIGQVRRRSNGKAALPIPSAENHSFDRPRLLFLEPVPLGAKVVDFGMHPAEEEFSRGRGDPRPLELEDFLALPGHLDAHSLDFSPDMVKHGRPLWMAD